MREAALSAVSAQVRHPRNTMMNSCSHSEFLFPVTFAVVDAIEISDCNTALRRYSLPRDLSFVALSVHLQPVAHFLGRAMAFANHDPLSSHVAAAWQETEACLTGTFISFA